MFNKEKNQRNVFMYAYGPQCWGACRVFLKTRFGNVKNEILKTRCDPFIYALRVWESNKYGLKKKKNALHLYLVLLPKHLNFGRTRDLCCISRCCVIRMNRR